MLRAALHNLSAQVTVVHLARPAEDMIVIANLLLPKYKILFVS